MFLLKMLLLELPLHVGSILVNILEEGIWGISPILDAVLRD